MYIIVKCYIAIGVRHVYENLSLRATLKIKVAQVSVASQTKPRIFFKEPINYEAFPNNKGRKFCKSRTFAKAKANKPESILLKSFVL